MIFTGEKCPACGEIFSAEDDVVVCPECGAPQHRECYNKTMACACADKHAQGFRYKREKPEEKKPAAIGVREACPVCRLPNMDKSHSCPRCGARLDIELPGESEKPFGERPSARSSPQIDDELPRDSLSFLGYDPNEDVEGATLGEISSFVGPNSLYYVPIFKRMKDRGKRISMNFSCLLFPSLYFANRRMWFWAVLAGVVGVLLALPSAAMSAAAFLSDVSGAKGFVDAVEANSGTLEELDAAFGIADWMLRILYCIFGNWLYFRYVLSSIKRLRAQGVDGRSDPALLTEAGGVRPKNMLVIIGLMAGFAALSVLATAIAIAT